MEWPLPGQHVQGRHMSWAGERQTVCPPCGTKNLASWLAQAFRRPWGVPSQAHAEGLAESAALDSAKSLRYTWGDPAQPRSGTVGARGPSPVPLFSALEPKLSSRGPMLAECPIRTNPPPPGACSGPARGWFRAQADPCSALPLGPTSHPFQLGVGLATASWASSAP